MWGSLGPVRHHIRRLGSRTLSIRESCCSSIIDCGAFAEHLPNSDFLAVSLSVFAVFYGLAWLATVPPLCASPTKRFVDKNAPLVFGLGGRWPSARAAWRACFACFVRSAQGDYLQAFMISPARPHRPRPSCR